jgi:glucosamine--fructose-6-phosphate aminotransferase (isomerizing)
MMEAEGIVFKTETDTEVVAQLVTRELATTNDPRMAVARALPQLRGAFALAFIFEGEPDLMIGARQGAPLAVGHGDGEMYLGSDALALAPFTDTITYLDDGDWVVLNRAEAEYRDANNVQVPRKKQKTSAGAFLVDKGNHRHFMAKEIHEQPEAVGRTLAHYLDMTRAEVALPFTLPFAWKDLTRLTISACGTAYLAGYIGKYWFERYARLPVEIDVASEFRYREAPLPEKGLAIFLSQSGETADTLAALRYAKQCHQSILSVVNVTTSPIARESDIVAPILSGPEIGVASTKAFTCQLAVLACLAIAAGVDRGTLSKEEAARLVNELILTPGRISEALHREASIRDIAQRLTKATDVLYIGRGPAYPLAQEGALKLKEISYIHAEAYAAGELKHGPIALIDEKMPVIVIAPHDPLYEKTISNMQEVAARGGNIILIAEDQAAEQSGLDGIALIAMPGMASDFAAIPYAVPVQLLAYWTAFLLGKDVDQPRNLAKSVTVE